MTVIRLPAEWEKQQSIWIAFPFDDNEWHHHLHAAQIEIAAFARILSQNGQNVELICRNEAIKNLASKMIGDTNIRYHIERYGDIWLRDTGPLSVWHDDKLYAQLFQFNGWGGKFLMEGDQDIGAAIAALQKLPTKTSSYILEGGAIDSDGTGNFVTTCQCLLNSNRNPRLSKKDIEIHLMQDCGAKNILWLDQGLMGDHTDGHVDNLARFVGTKHILIPLSETTDDPNAVIYEDAASKAIDFGYKISRIISAGRYEIDGNIAPASYMNFVIANDIVIVPQFNIASDLLAIETISKLFPNKQCIGMSSIALLSGGGSFHCASQQLAAI